MFGNNYQSKRFYFWGVQMYCFYKYQSIVFDIFYKREKFRQYFTLKQIT